MYMYAVEAECILLPYLREIARGTSLRVQPFTQFCPRVPAFAFACCMHLAPTCNRNGFHPL